MAPGGPAAQSFAHAFAGQAPVFPHVDRLMFGAAQQLAIVAHDAAQRVRGDAQVFGEFVCFSDVFLRHRRYPFRMFPCRSPSASGSRIRCVSARFADRRMETENAGYPVDPRFQAVRGLRRVFDAAGSHKTPPGRPPVASAMFPACAGSPKTPPGRPSGTRVPQDEKGPARFERHAGPHTAMSGTIRRTSSGRCPPTVPSTRGSPGAGLPAHRRRRRPWGTSAR